MRWMYTFIIMCTFLCIYKRHIKQRRNGCFYEWRATCWFFLSLSFSPYLAPHSRLGWMPVSGQTIKGKGGAVVGGEGCVGLCRLFASKRVFFSRCICALCVDIFLYKSHYYFMFVECLGTLWLNDCFFLEFWWWMLGLGSDLMMACLYTDTRGVGVDLTL